ncbi:hypothetical protein GC207_10045 [bacterium]|nr:hypothetical protein [bacterium]
MKNPLVYPNILFVRTLTRLAFGTALAGALVLPFYQIARADEPAQPKENQPDRPPRDEVRVERRVVVRDGDERPDEMERDRRPPRPEEQERHLAELREHATDLRKDGHPEEAERVEREIDEIQRQPRGFDRPPRRPRDPRPPMEIGRIQERLNHLQIAAANLHAAGLPDLAQAVEREADETRRQLEERAHRDHPEGPPPREELEQLHREIDELHHQIDELRQELHRPDRH